MHFNYLTTITILFALMFCANAIPSTLGDSELNKVVGQQTDREKKAAAEAAAKAERQRQAQAAIAAEAERLRKQHGSKS